jgi:hypothetical protein
LMDTARLMPPVCTHAADCAGHEPSVDLATLPDAERKPQRTELQMIFQDPHD